MRTPKYLALIIGAVALVGCQSGSYDASKHMNMELTPLDTHRIGVGEDTRMLEIAIDPQINTLTKRDRELIRRFVKEYRDVGHGAFVMSPPRGGSNPQLANEAVRITRQIAWEGGINYDDMVGQPYVAPPHTHAPFILAYRAYNILPPECETMATIDLSDVSSNNPYRNFGCAVRYNQAMMISDPADVLGERPLDPPVTDQLLNSYDGYVGG